MAIVAAAAAAREALSRSNSIWIASMAPLPNNSAALSAGSSIRHRLYVVRVCPEFENVIALARSLVSSARRSEWCRA